MAITSSAKKAIRVNARQRVFNIRRMRALRSTTKKAKASSTNDKEALSMAYKAIDKAVKTKVIKPNTANRKKSRLSALVKTRASA